MLTAPCRFATTTDIPYAGTLTQDGITAEEGDRVLVKNQDLAEGNGIYVVGPSPSFALARASDLVGTHDADQGIFVPVNRGTANEATLWRVANIGTIEIGAAPLAFEPADPNGVFFRAPFLRAVTRTAQQKMRDFVSVKDFGAVGDGDRDDTDAIQAAIASRANAIYFPEGTYKISKTINIPIGRGMHLFGAGFTETVLQASGGAPFDSILNIGSPNTPGYDPTTFGTIEDMKFSGSDERVKYGIYGSKVDHFTFRRISCLGFQEAGISIGYGWCNNFIDSEFSDNAGHGLKLNIDFQSGGNNAVNIRNCVFGNNAKHGIFAQSGYGLSIDGCTIEQNAAGGIFLANFSGFSISSYFERNAATGHQFSIPPRTIKADIILCGAGTTTEMASAYPCKGGTISSCVVSSTSQGDIERNRNTRYSTVFVYDAGAVDCSVRNCVLNTETLPPFALIAWEYTQGWRGYDWSVESCSSFTKIIDERNATPQTSTFSERTRILHSHANLEKTARRFETKVKTAQGRNYANVDFNTWIQLATGSPSTYRKSQAAAPLQFWNGLPIWSINSTAAAKSHTFGMRLTAGDYPDLIGKLMWYGIWTYAIPGATAHAQPHCNRQQFTLSPPASGGWVFDAVSFIWPMPREGEVECGIHKDGTGTGDVYFTAPMLMEVGTHMNEALETIPLLPYTWRGKKAPTSGRWLVGDTVLNSAPGAGGFPGWVCTKAGTPGTWKAMANLVDLAD